MGKRKAFSLFAMMMIMGAFLHSPASALEKRSVAFNDDRVDSWNAGTTCRVSYYNICTGWLWCWSNLPHHFQFGVVSEACCGQGEPAALCQSHHFFCAPAPAGYGFTGSIAVYAVDANDCPMQPPIQSQPFIPSSQIQTVNWDCVPVPSRFAIVMSVVGGQSNPVSIATDHPAVGPTGPQSCGLCFPEDRLNHSFKYGAAGSPVCPGSTFNDGICDAQLFWDIDLACSVSVEDTSWGKIKSLYR